MSFSLIKSKNMKKIIKIEYLPEFNIKKVDSITDLKKICDSLKEEIKQIPESKFLILDNNYLALREELLNNQVTKKTEKVLIDCFITHIEPTNIEEGIRKGCRRMSCLIEDFSQKNYICKQCNFEASYFYNYDLYLQFHPQSFDIIKVNLNTLRELEGDGLISIDPNIAKRDIKTLKEKMFDLINSQTITTLCIELPTWKVLGKYSLV